VWTVVVLDLKKQFDLGQVGPEICFFNLLVVLGQLFGGQVQLFDILERGFYLVVEVVDVFYLEFVHQSIFNVIDRDLSIALSIKSIKQLESNQICLCIFLSRNFIQ